MVMIVINIHEAKAKLSEFLEAAARGERVLICKRNRPVAELRAVESARTEPRPFGGAAGRFGVPDSFFEPLPDEELDAFDGNDAQVQGASRVAEKKASYEVPPRRSKRS
jgi:prevent-host-death family protein